MNWHCLGLAEIYRRLGTTEQGLSTAAADETGKRAGPNELKEDKRQGVIRMLLAQLKDAMILILMIAAVISGIIGDLTDTLVILVIVLLNAVIGFSQEYRAGKAMQALKKMAVTQARVLRDGKSVWLPSTVLVPGDVIFLEAGNVIPADLRIIESINLKIEEAALTGESHAVDKISQPLAQADLPVADRSNMAFSGTFVTYGRGRAVVIGIGMQTELGRIARMLQQKEPLTPLQQRMTSFSKTLSVIILLLCAVFFVSGALRGEDIVRMILTAISLAVAAIPEALPAVITISLALAAKRMIRLNCLVRKLPAVETLGSVTYICTDKTGTLTQNKMHLEKVFVNGRLYAEADLSSIRHHENGRLLLRAFRLNNDAVIGDDGKIRGDSLEIALLEAARDIDRCSREQEDWRSLGPEDWCSREPVRLAEIPFDADRKLMTTFHPEGKTVVSFTKGAPEVLLKECVDIDEPAFQHEVDEMAAMGYRVLGFACRYWDNAPENPDPMTHESGLHFLGLAGIADPPRKEVFDAVAQCRTAGIVPVIITGDHPLTARAIAQRTGILEKKQGGLITGEQLAQLDEESFLARVEDIRVYARVSPEQKVQIISALQQKGHFVAMTGDGVNDAPSLKRANIGVAMGITGTDVAKGAAHMILLDDNFATIVKAIREGRRIYDNILKFIKYLMTTNSGELWTLLLGPFIGLPIALLPIHILWINLVSDGLPAIALSFEKAEPDIMTRPPRPPQQSIFAEGRGMHMVLVGILMAGIVLSVQAWSIKQGLHWQTIVFNVICLTQMGHVLAIRSETRSLFRVGIFSNLPLMGAVLLTFLLQFAVTFVPFLQSIFQTRPLTLREFVIVGIASSIVFLVVEAGKIFRWKSHRKSGV